MARNHNVVQRSHGRNPGWQRQKPTVTEEPKSPNDDETASDDDEIPLDHKGKGRRPGGPTKKV